MGGEVPDTPFWCRHKWEEEEEGTRLRMWKIFCDKFFGLFFAKILFCRDFLAAANLFSDADTSGREADSGYERCRDCTDITLHRHHSDCHRRSTCFKLSDFLQENRDSFVFPSLLRNFCSPMLCSSCLMPDRLPSGLTSSKVGADSGRKPSRAHRAASDSSRRSACS